MMTRFRTIMGVALIGMGIALLFQNCSGDFALQGLTGGGGGGDPIHLTSAPSIGVYDGTDSIKPDSLITGKSYLIQLANVTGSPSVDYQFGYNSANCTLTGNSISALNMVCSHNGQATIQLVLTYGDGTIAHAEKDFIIRDTALATPTPNPNDPKIFAFHIKAGTGSNSYNTAATYALVFVGQSIKFYNDDSVNHELHTGGSPVAHGTQEMMPGGTDSYSVISAHENVNANDVYDHISGPSALFYVKAIDGKAKYMNTCAGCHGNIASSTKLGRSFSQIKNAIATINAMKSIALTDDELKGIEYNLNN
jgi:plastocyanin